MGVTFIHLEDSGSHCYIGVAFIHLEDSGSHCYTGDSFRSPCLLEGMHLSALCQPNLFDLRIIGNWNLLQNMIFL